MLAVKVIPNDIDKCARPRVRNRARWVLPLLLTQAAAGCADDRTTGEFGLRASGTIQSEFRGSVYAKTEWESGGYWIVLEVPQQHPPMGAEDLSFMFASKPDSGTWSGARSLLREGHDFTIGFGPAACSVALRWDADSTIPSYWQVDSGWVHIATPLAVRGVSGSFRVFTQLKKCAQDDTTARPSPGDTARRMVMEGTFATHPHGDR